ncbi:chain length determinant protein EpsF [Paucibacter sp. AS339]|uniref:chain length determinant protein EpsF n=1 Tax=Paucibacter hankyongi TaxID=3133434 RepID=UPI003096D006
MNISQFFAVIAARWKIVTVVFLLTVLTALAISLSMAKQYSASASVVIDAKPDPVSAVMYQGMVSPAVMATQIDIIQSDRVAQRVVRNLKLAQNPQIREQWQQETGGKGTVEGWLASTFQKSMDVKPSRESNVITISYRAPDPKFAAGVANAYVQAFLDVAIEMRVDPAKQYSSFFDQRVKDARDALEKAQARLSDFQKESGIIANDERLDIENSRLNELSSQLVVVQAISAESGSRQTQARGADAERMQEVLNNPLISSLKGDVGRMEARLQEMNSKYGDNHPSVLEAKANIAELRLKMNSEIAKVTGGVVVSNSINRQREAEIRTALETQRAKVLQLKAVRDQGSVLSRDAEGAQRTYEQVLARLSQTNLESQSTQSNVSVLTLAEPPLVHSSPRVMLNVMLSAVLGFMLAIGAALVIEMVDRRVRVQQDLIVALGLPVLGTLPKPSAKTIKGQVQSVLIQQRVVGQ